MRRRRSLLVPAVAVAALLVLTPSAVAAPPIEDVRSFSESFEVDGAAALIFEMAVGELKLVGADVDRIEVTVRIECDDENWGSDSCPRRAERVEIESRRRGDRLEISLAGTSAWRNRGMGVHVEVRAPADLAAHLDMSIGELTVERMRGDVEVELGIGEVNVEIDESVVRAVHLDVGTGEASLRGRGPGRRENAGLFVRELRWDEGTGSKQVKVDLGIGEISVRLD